jgi:hypothetical protein
MQHSAALDGIAAETVDAATQIPAVSTEPEILDSRYRLIRLRSVSDAGEVWLAHDIRLKRGVLIELTTLREATPPRSEQLALILDTHRRRLRRGCRLARVGFIRLRGSCSPGDRCGRDVLDIDRRLGHSRGHPPPRSCTRNANVAKRDARYPLGCRRLPPGPLANATGIQSAERPQLAGSFGLPCSLV